MSIIDKWLNVHRDEFSHPATSATPATIPNSTHEANDLDVANPLRHFATFQPNVAECRSNVADTWRRKTQIHYELTPNVADVANVAGGKNLEKFATSTESSSVARRDSPLPEGPLCWSAEIDQLDPDRPPRDVPRKRWRLLLEDCARLRADGVFEKAMSLGWSLLDLFGCDESKPYGHVDSMGLAWLVTGWRVVMISEDAAILETPTGSRQTYRRKPGAEGRVLAWELTASPQRMREPD